MTAPYFIIAVRDGQSEITKLIKVFKSWMDFEMY